MLNLFIILCFYWVYQRSRRWVYVHLFLFFPATLAHELMHYFAALISFGKPQAPYLWPKKIEGSWVAGYVICQRLTTFNAAPIAMAPFALLPLAYWLYMQSLHSAHGSQQVVLWVVATGMCVAGAVPSGQDFKLMFRFPLSVLMWGSLFLGTCWLYILPKIQPYLSEFWRAHS